MPGPSKKPAAKAKEDGTYRKDKYRDDIADLLLKTEDIPAPPEILNKIGLAAWNRFWGVVHSVNGYILPTDHTLVEEFIINYQFTREAAKEISENGVVVDGKINPYYRVYNLGVKQHIKFCSMLGLSPADRTKINLQLHISKKIKKGFDAIPQGKPTINIDDEQKKD